MNILSFLSGNADSHIDLIIENRKKMEELSHESNYKLIESSNPYNVNNNTLSSNENNVDFTAEKEKENLKKFILDKEIAIIIMAPARLYLV